MYRYYVLDTIHRLSRFFFKTKRFGDWILKRCVLKNKQDGVLDKDKTTENVQIHNICTNVPSSQNFRSYLNKIYSHVHVRVTSDLLHVVTSNISFGKYVHQE
jgi:hypothetical protein